MIFFSLNVKNSIPRNRVRQPSKTIAVEGPILAFGFSKKYDISLLSIECRILDRCRAFDRLACVDAHLWVTGCIGTNRNLFQRTLLVSRMFEENQQPAIQTKLEQPFGGFFQQIKVRQPIGKKGFYTNCDPNKQEVGFIKLIKSCLGVNQCLSSESCTVNAKTEA